MVARLAASATAADVPLDANAIFDRTRSTVAARASVPYIEYTQYVALQRHGTLRVERSHIVLRTSDGKVHITPLADSPADRVGASRVADRPMVYPTTTFGLVKRSVGEQPSTFESTSITPVTPHPGDQVYIGHVVATAREYDPSLIGSEKLLGANVYHLKLVPRFDPQHHPIRDLYVDTTTFEPRRIAIEVWAAVGPVRSRPTVTVDFAPVDGTWLIAHATLTFVMRLAFLSYGGSAEFRISDVTFPPTEPGWMFDATLLAKHAQDALRR